MLKHSSVGVRDVISTQIKVKDEESIMMQPKCTSPKCAKMLQVCWLAIIKLNHTAILIIMLLCELKSRWIRLLWANLANRLISEYYDARRLQLLIIFQ